MLLAIRASAEFVRAQFHGVLPIRRAGPSASTPGGLAVQVCRMRDTLSPFDDRQDIGEVVGPHGLVVAGSEGVPSRVVPEGVKVVRSACEGDPV